MPFFRKFVALVALVVCSGANAGAPKEIFWEDFYVKKSFYKFFIKLSYLERRDRA